MLKEELLKEIKEDEKEYCFDRSYYSDEFWEREFPDETREEAYNRVISIWQNVDENIFIDEVKEYFGDKYDYIINNRIK